MIEKNKEKLIEVFLDKIQGKSVYSTLKNIISGKQTDPYFVLKGLFSTATHLCIECEQGNTEYKDLLNEVYMKIQEKMKNI